MALLSNVIKVGKFVCKCIYPKVENIVRFSSKIENLREEMIKIIRFREDIRAMVEEAQQQGYKPRPDVLKWIEHVGELVNEWETMQESIASAKTLTYKCCSNCSLRSEVFNLARNIHYHLSVLKEGGESFKSNLVVENYRMKQVEFIPVPSIEGQYAARILNEILQRLEDDKICIIGVLGPGGIGKTTLMKNLYNELLKIDVPTSKLSFGVVVWVTVPKMQTNIRMVQAQIASRLDLKIDNKGTVESNASKIYQRLKQEQSFLLILDDVWEAINLDDIGVPQLEDPARNKVIIISDSRNVCKEMKTEKEIGIYFRGEVESWQLFVKCAGDVANLEHIQPLAKKILTVCRNLPLSIIIIGKSMRGKTRVELWEDALESLRTPRSYYTFGVETVHKVIKWSIESLESADIESSSKQKSQLVNKKRGDIKSCFLYCSLYQGDIPIDELINCWSAEGFLGEHDTYEEAYNRGITMIKSLKDACLLETHTFDSVRMHNVVREGAVWIAHFSLHLVPSRLTDELHLEALPFFKIISFASTGIERLPDWLVRRPLTRSLFFQDNEHLEEIPDDLFFAFPSLRILNLSETGIRVLPSSINSLCQLRALILRNCHSLRELPPIDNLCNLQFLDCENTVLRCLPQGLDKLTNLWRLNLPVADLKSISKGFFLKLSRIEMLNILDSDMTNLRLLNLLGPTSFDEISSLLNLTSLFIRLDSSVIFNRDHSWMSRLKRFHIEVGNAPTHVRLNKLTRMISVSECEIFSNGELSSMLQFASDLNLVKCKGLRKLLAYNSFDGLKSLSIERCFCDFEPSKEGGLQFDPLPNLEHLSLVSVDHLKSVSDFGQFLGLTFSKLRQLDIHFCASLTYVFKAFSVPKHLEDISITFCPQLVELLAQCGPSRAPLVNSEIPRVRKLHLRNLPNLGMLGEPQSMWEHLEEHDVINCDRIEHRKLPLSIQTTNIKAIKGFSEWWSLLAVSGD